MVISREQGEKQVGGGEDSIKNVTHTIALALDILCHLDTLDNENKR